MKLNSKKEFWTLNIQVTEAREQKTFCFSKEQSSLVYKEIENMKKNPTNR